MSRQSQTLENLKFLKESINSETRVINIRLRPGEYQFDLAKGIASFEIQLGFPNVKELIGKLYGKEKTQDIRFLRKIQTVLKKMEKSNVVKILPKKKPWELQEYALTSFKFQDVYENQVVLATESDLKRTLDLVNSHLSPLDRISMPKPSYAVAKIWILISMMVISYIAILWALMQPNINLVVFVFASCIATICSIFLGVTISRRE